MEMLRSDSQRAYEALRERITTLAMPPGAPVNDQQLASELEMALGSVQEAIRLLAHEHLITVTPRHGLYVAEVNIPDLEKISELRLELETLAARLAAERRTDDDLVVLEALRLEQLAADPADAAHLFAVDHHFHVAITHAAHNRYLAETLDHFFGLSQRLWYVALPRIQSLPASVEKHLDIVEAIRSRDADGAARVMHDHVAGFYAEARAALAARGQA